MANITPLLLNSCILVIVVVPCVVIFCSLGGYAFAQLKVPCKGLIYVLFLVGLTIPFETLVTPLYYEISGMGLLNTRLALILPLIGLNIPFGIVWMRSCFEQMPRDLIEARIPSMVQAICARSVPFSCRWHCQPSPRSVF